MKEVDKLEINKIYMLHWDCPYCGLKNGYYLSRKLKEVDTRIELLCKCGNKTVVEKDRVNSVIDDYKKAEWI